MDIKKRKLSDSVIVFSDSSGKRATYNTDFSEVSIVGSVDFNPQTVNSEDEAEQYFCDYLSALASSDDKEPEQRRPHGGRRKGSGRKKSDDPKSPMRVTESEKAVIEWLRDNPLEMDAIRMKMF
ncbi:hypothetical protein [Pseudoalteromonas rubra]|uniref:Uncharacterized protein n=1 Tax=Pseudoalteromonas rubra TaxID=43658 RepID=A0A0U3HX85_9GAMM|nr:hypothetical protein [Pseudoalteromonas rubra]ALU45656.1 hypothetical protein AT705_22215 [Pseudoalteromonas rubra]